MLIDPRVAQAADGITIADDGRSATVNGTTIAAESRRELRGQLALHFYREFHSGAAPSADPTMMPRRSHDSSFEAELYEAVPHLFTPTRGLLLDVDDTGSGVELIVRLPEITARVPLDRYVGGRVPTPGELVNVLLDARRPNVSPGFYYVMGSRQHADPAAGVRRLFIHLAAAHLAPAVWHTVLSRLECAEVSYHAKILSDRGAYARRDALVVYLTEAPNHTEQDIADAIAGHPGVAPEISIFTERYGPGVGGADDPADVRPGQTGLSFGQHRSATLAAALMRHAADPSGPTRDDVIARTFRAALIDPLRPARNLATKDLTHV